MALVAYGFFTPKQRKNRGACERVALAPRVWMSPGCLWMLGPSNSHKTRRDRILAKRRFIMPPRSSCTLSVVLGLLSATWVLAGADDPYDQSAVPLEVQP